MRRGVLFLILGIVVIALFAAVLFIPGILPGQEPVASAVPLPTPVQTFKALIAQQAIDRGRPIGDDMLGSRDELITNRTPGMLEDNDFNRRKLVGKVASHNILEGEILALDAVIDKDTYLRGSDAALFIPPEMVAVALPVDRLSSVAYAIQPGDHVDVIATFLIVDVDQQSQTILPDYTTLVGSDGNVTRDLPSGLSSSDPRTGVPLPGDAYNTINWLWPNPGDNGGQQRPRAVTNLTVQNALVLRFGEWSTAGLVTPVPTRQETQPEGSAVPSGGGQAAQALPPTATPIPRPDIVTLALKRSDALVLMYMLHTGASLELALRPTGDLGDYSSTQSVSLGYMFSRFNIEMPQKLPYSTEPGLWPLKAIPASISDPLFLTPAPHPNPTWAPGK